MFNMIKADVYRIFRSVGFYIGIGMMILLLGLSLFMCEPGRISSVNITVNGESIVEELVPPSSVMMKNGEITADDLKSMTIMDFRKMAVGFTGYQLDRDIIRENMNLYYVFLFVVAIIISFDFTSGAIKNTLSSAISKRNYYVSKLLIIYSLCTIIVFANTYLCYFANLIINGKNLSSSIGLMTKFTLMQLPVMLALVSIICGIAFIVKKTAVFNMITIPFGLFYPILYSLVLKLFNISTDKMCYNFQNMIYTLATSPDTDYIITCYVICIIVSIVFVSLGWLTFRKSEI